MDMTAGYLFDLRRENNTLCLRMDVSWSPYNPQAQSKVVTVTLIEPEMIDNLFEVLAAELDGELLYKILDQEGRKSFEFEGNYTDEAEVLAFHCVEI